MAIPDDLLNSIQADLSAAVQPGVNLGTAVWDIFEVYIFALVLRAANNVGANISFQNVSGNSPTPGQMVFRSSPGNIYSTAKPYSHAVLAFPGKPLLEAHVGIYVSAKSRVAHECDVAVLYQDEAQTCRQNRVHPRYHKLILSAECKFYSTALGIDLARSFLGLLSDLQSDGRFFVTNTYSESVQSILAHHKKDWESEVLPGNGAVTRLVSRFETEFRDFIAKNR